MEKLLLSPREAFALLGVSHTHGYALIKSGRIPSIKLGRSRRIPRQALEDWVERTTGEPDPPDFSNLS